MRFTYTLPAWILIGLCYSYMPTEEALHLSWWRDSSLHSLTLVLAAWWKAYGPALASPAVLGVDGPWTQASQRVRPNTGKIGSGLAETYTIKIPCPNLFETFPPLTAIISGFTGTASLTYLVLGQILPSSQHRRDQKQSHRLLPASLPPSPTTYTELQFSTSELLGTGFHLSFFLQTLLSSTSWVQQNSSDHRSTLFAFPLQAGCTGRAPEADARRKMRPFWCVTVLPYLLITHCITPLV